VHAAIAQKQIGLITHAINDVPPFAEICHRLLHVCLAKHIPIHSLQWQHLQQLCENGPTQKYTTNVGLEH